MPGVNADDGVQRDCARCGSYTDSGGMCGWCRERFWHCRECDRYPRVGVSCAGCGYMPCHLCSVRTPYGTVAALDAHARVNRTLCETCGGSESYTCSCGLRFLNGVSCGRCGTESDWCGRDDYRSIGARPAAPVREPTIRQWNYRPTPEFRGDGPLFLGMELEMQVPSDGSGSDRWIERINGAADVVQDAFGDVVYLKQDGSIGGGFEMVTHPMSYGWAMGELPWSGLDVASDAGCVAADSCGLHVHVSRAGFTGTSHIYRWMKFVHRNKVQVQTLARRNSSWAKFTPGGRGDVSYYAKGSRDGDRYQAINPQNEATFELRVFGSSLDAQTVQAALGFADSSVRYAQHIDSQKIIRERAWDWASFYKWLDSQGNYAPLVREMEKLSCVC